MFLNKEVDEGLRGCEIKEGKKKKMEEKCKGEDPKFEVHKGNKLKL